MSLLYTMQGMRDLGHDCVVALTRPSRALWRVYTSAGFETVSSPRLAMWDHSTVAERPIWNPKTWVMLGELLLTWRRTTSRTLQLVRKVKPDLVHLNSMPLVPSARALVNAQIPFVWHVREPPPDQGVRTRIIRGIMKQASHLIFISDFDRREWLGDSTATVIPNFVATRDFRHDADGRLVRNECRIPPEVKVILYLGGVSEVKGVFVLLDALRLLKMRGLKFVCLMMGVSLGPPQSLRGRIGSRVLPLMGSGTPRQKVGKLISKYGLEPSVRLLPFATDVVPFFAACNAVVFPATKPHFARPIIESIAMHKAAVGTNVGGVRELISLHPRGYLAPPSDAVGLADALDKSLNSEGVSADLDSLFASAKEGFRIERGVAAIDAVYRQVLRDKSSQ